MHNQKLATVVLWAAVVMACVSFVDGAEAAQGGRRQEEFDFDSQGVQVGQVMPDATVYALDGTPQRLAGLWKDRPVLLVTASLTCPVARQQSPAVQRIADRIDADVAVAMLYTIEAHPSGDPSPYAEGREWLTPQNRREGLLCRQPRTLEERLERAQEFQDRLGISVPIFVDGMENQAWQALGGGPNLAVLIRPSGVVQAKRGWFDQEAMLQAIQALGGPETTQSR